MSRYARPLLLPPHPAMELMHPVQAQAGAKPRALQQTFISPGLSLLSNSVQAATECYLLYAVLCTIGSLIALCADEPDRYDTNAGPDSGA